MNRKDIIDILEWNPRFVEHEEGGLLSRIERVVAQAVAAERKAIEPIVFGLCISDNNAQEIVNAIRKRGQE